MPEPVSLEPISTAISDVRRKIGELQDLDDHGEAERAKLDKVLKHIDKIIKAQCPQGDRSYIVTWQG